MKRVGIVLPVMSGYALSVIEGVSRYANLHEPWDLRTDPRTPFGDIGSLEAWEGDGLVIYLKEPLRLPMPTVNLATAMADQAPTVVPDHDRIGRLAAEHLLERGFRRLGFYAGWSSAYAQARLGAYADRAGEAGVPVAAHIGDAGLKPWLTAMEKPAAVLCANDDDAAHVLRKARELEIAIPEELALLGVDNEHVLCDALRPTLSSIDTDLVRIGYEAASMLAQLLSGGEPRRRLRRVPPRGVVERQSTRALAMDDPAMRRAVQFLREHATRAIGVNDVVAAAAVSRSTLERRFRETLGRSPQQEIVRLRIERAKQLLTDTNWTVARIAAAVGVADANYFASVFSRQTGQAPSRYRRERRASFER